MTPWPRSSIAAWASPSLSSSLLLAQLSPLRVCVLFHVSSCLFHIFFVLHTLTHLHMMQVFCEHVPFKWFLTFKHHNMDAKAIEDLFDLEIVPKVDMLLAYFD
jgi:hypothetical protein